jgi:hypothetical protein
MVWTVGSVPNFEKKYAVAMKCSEKQNSAQFQTHIHAQLGIKL